MRAPPEPDSEVTRFEVKQEVMSLIRSGEFPASREFSQGSLRLMSGNRAP